MFSFSFVLSCHSADSLLSEEEREEKQKQAELRATFLQQLVLSTLLGDK